MGAQAPLTFNGPLESGLRALSVLVPAYPMVMDLQRLVAFDYLIVHTADAGGPESLHPRLPLRAGELLVRRELVERGLQLMIGRKLVERLPTAGGIVYQAGDLAETFLDALTVPYLAALKERGAWVVEAISEMSDATLRETMDGIFGQWMSEFQMMSEPGLMAPQ